MFFISALPSLGSGGAFEWGDTTVGSSVMLAALLLIGAVSLTFGHRGRLRPP
jgi:hypothetical protein